MSTLILNPKRIAYIALHTLDFIAGICFWSYMLWYYPIWTIIVLISICIIVYIALLHLRFKWRKEMR